MADGAVGCAVVRFGARRWDLPVGVSLTFGRSWGCDIPLGVEPGDDFVSRSAGSLTALDDGVLVRNTSTTKTVVLFALPGPEIPIRPGAAVGTMPYRHLQLVIPSRFGRRYVLHLDTRPRHVPVPPVQPVIALPGQPTASGAERVTGREQRMLVVLCAPLLTTAGGEPATYRQIAQQCGTTPQAVRTCLDRLRARLSDVEGVPGLRASEDDVGVAATYLTALAQWAIDSGVVSGTAADEVG